MTFPVWVVAHFSILETDFRNFAQIHFSETDFCVYLLNWGIFTFMTTIRTCVRLKA